MLNKSTDPYSPPILFPHHLKDLGIFNIETTLRGKKVVKALLDSGASINLMLYSVYLQLSLVELKPMKCPFN